MADKRAKAEKIVLKLRQVEVLQGQGEYARPLAYPNVGPAAHSARCCQTVPNRSRFPTKHRNLRGEKLAPLVQSGVSV